MNSPRQRRGVKDIPNTPNPVGVQYDKAHDWWNPYGVRP